jgi:serine/threonine protein kinase
MTKFMTGGQFNGWTVESYIASGGNGDVYRASRATQTGAIKFLQERLWTGARYERFRSEVEAMRRCSDVPGVLPLFDVSCPDAPNAENPPWFVMCLAEPLQGALGTGATLRDVISACADIAETLAAIHERGFSHRDIKPGNLFKISDRYGIGDFGLVDYPGKLNVTSDERTLGPIHYMAPEMLNHASVADGQRADVYSFAKTIWVVATGQNYPLPGVLDSTIPAMTLSANVVDSKAALLDRVLERATQFYPSARPSMRSLAAELRAWLNPASSVGRKHALDLSEFAQTIASMNERHHVEERTSSSERQRIEGDGTRLREMVRPAAKQILDALTAAHFVNPRLSIDNYFWGFNLGGHVMATAWRGEVSLKLSVSIQIPPSGTAGDITADYRYVAESNEAANPKKRYCCEPRRRSHLVVASNKRKCADCWTG